MIDHKCHFNPDNIPDPTSLDSLGIIKESMKLLGCLRCMDLMVCDANNFSEALKIQNVGSPQLIQDVQNIIDDFKQKRDKIEVAIKKYSDATLSHLPPEIQKLEMETEFTRKFGAPPHVQN